MEKKSTCLKGGGNADLDTRTIFVYRLPFTVSDSQLEVLFSEVGPVKHCFTVKETGSSKHRGFGFVQFALAEDAQKAIDSKNGSLLQGRRIKVELAKCRASLDQRRRRHKERITNGEEIHTSVLTSASTGEKKVSVDDTPKKRKKREDVNDPQTPKLELTDSRDKKRPKRDHSIEDQFGPSSTLSSSNVSVKSSAKQRSARTVVLGGIGSSDVLQELLTIAKTVGTIETVQNPFTKEELEFHTLAKDGCRPPAAAILYSSVRSASEAVAALHQHVVKGCRVWARQLGGEGSKVKKWRLIVRNVPFEVKEETLRELFSQVGFLWEIRIPQKADGSSRGFAFIGYTSKSNAEKAINLFNGTIVGGRPIAVDWAVGKKKFETFVSKLDAENTPGKHEEVSDNENETASEDDMEMMSRMDLAQSPSRSEPVQGDEIGALKSGKPVEALEEIELVNKVLGKLVAQGVEGTSSDLTIKSPQSCTKKTTPKQDLDLSKVSPSERSDALVKKEMSNKFDSTAKPAAGNLEKTIFIRNLPLDANVKDLRKYFSAFGIVKSLRLVLHGMTRKPKGTAFLEFDSEIAAKDAVGAAKENGEEKAGLVFGGKVLVIDHAVDRYTARDVSKQKFLQEHHDRRNLYLAKEGVIQEGTPAAEGVSRKDMAKRKLLENEKATKLRSPNFHISRTRLAIHNFPKTMTENELKKLFIDAVRSHASKQKPTIKQVKVLRDGEKSRGAGFIEFSEHQHALVALRVLNNNPDVFGEERRPIVEFAIENTLKLRERESRLAKAKTHNYIHGTKMQMNQRQQKKSEPSNITSVPDTAPVNSLSWKKAPKSKSSIKKRKVQSHAKANGSDLNDKPLAKELRGSISHPKKKVKSDILSNVNGMDNMKRPLPGETFTSQGNNNKNVGNHYKLAQQISGKKDRRKAAGYKLEDKLDKLVMEYQSKYFSSAPGSNNSSNAAVGLKRTSENLKRWFE